VDCSSYGGAECDFDSWDLNVGTCRNDRGCSHELNLEPPRSHGWKALTQLSVADFDSHLEASSVSGEKRGRQGQTMLMQSQDGKAQQQETTKVTEIPHMKVFTTGQVAKICKVAPRTVSKWFDSGRLKGYRIPGSQDRRIPRES
jgi:excisionase family DNA binding protein